MKIKVLRENQIISNKSKLLEMPTRSDYRLTLISIIHFVAKINEDFAKKYEHFIGLSSNKENVQIHHIKGDYIDNIGETHKIPKNQNIYNVAIIRKGLSHPQTLDINNLPPEDGISFIDLFKYIADSKDALESYIEELNNISNEVEQSEK